MKKLTFILMMALCLSFTACDNTGNINNKTDNMLYRVDKITVDNHDYILAKTTAIGTGGISIIHSESCECKKRNEK